MNPSNTFRLCQPDHQKSLGLSDPPKPTASMAERHRPKNLTDMVGQGYVVFRLETFLESPYSTAFLFEGPTGIGKTTAALAIASALGAIEFGGLEIIRSGEQDAESVERVLRDLRYTPMLGSGWKVIIADEADLMSPKAGHLWLSALEDLPAKSVVIFTTNRASKFQDRFLDRCERFTFEADSTTHLHDAQLLINRIWAVEARSATGHLLADSPSASELPGILDSNGQISYRRIVRALEPMIAEIKRRPAAPVDSTHDRNKIDWEKIASRYRSGEKLSAISRQIGVPAETIHGRLKRLGVQFNRRRGLAS
jgi:replication-associated recombination protein RarA